MYSPCLTWLADSHHRAMGGGSQLCSFIRSTRLGQPLCCSEPRTANSEMGQQLPSRELSMFHPSAQDWALTASPPPEKARVPYQKPCSSWIEERQRRNVTQKGGEGGIQHNPERVENYLESTWLFSPTSSSSALEATQLSNGNFRHPWPAKRHFPHLNNTELI